MFTVVKNFTEKLSYSKTNYYFSFVSDITIGVASLSCAFYYFDIIWYEIAISVVGGIILWSLTEYIFHRFMFHGKNPESIVVKGHDHHHQQPKDIVGMPFFTGVVMYLLGFLPLYPIIELKHNLIVSAFYVIAYSYYGMVHHMTHHYKPSSRYYKRLLGAHNVHHKQPNKNFGVTTLVWDRVFGTYFKSGKKDAN